MDVPQHSLHELPKVQRSQARMYSVPDVLGNALMSHAVMEFLEHSLGGDWLGGLAAGCSTGHQGCGRGTVGRAAHHSASSLTLVLSAEG